MQPSQSPAPIGDTRQPPDDHNEELGNQGIPSEPAPASQVPASSDILDEKSIDVEWTASQFIAHQKTLSWYLVLGGSSLMLAIAIWFLTRDVISTFVVVLSTAMLAFYASHQPKQVFYRLSEQGITVNGIFHSYETYRAYSIVSEGAFQSIQLSPLKRFALRTAIFYDPVDSESIIDILSSRLPQEPDSRDMIDKFMSRIRY